MSPAERLAAVLPVEVIEQLERVLPRVDHAGTTRVELHHGPEGQITDAEITPASKRVRIVRRAS
jgi:hypothetical protein